MKTMAIITSAAAGAVLLTLGAGGTTLAFWADGVNLSAGPIDTGTLELEIDSHTETLSLDSLLLQDMFPGDRRIQEVEVITQGNVVSDLTVSGIVDSNGHQVRIAPIACPGSTLTIPPIGTTAIGLGEWQPGIAQTLCIEVTLPATAPQGITTDFTLAFVATQQEN